MEQLKITMRVNNAARTKTERNRSSPNRTEARTCKIETARESNGTNEIIECGDFWGGIKSVAKL